MSRFQAQLGRVILSPGIEFKPSISGVKLTQKSPKSGFPGRFIFEWVGSRLVLRVRPYVK
jgi:hypothetical protein